MGCFKNPIVVSSSVLYNILYCIVESFSFIRGHRHGWSNHVKTSCTVRVIVLSLYSWTNVVGIKAFAGTTIGIRAWVEDFWKSKRSSKLSLALQLVSKLGLKIYGREKDHKAHKMKTKGIFAEGGVDCSFVVIWYKKVCVMERLKINFMEFGPRWRLLRSVPNS